MTWFRVGGAGIPASLKNGMNAVLNKKFGTSGQNYPPNGWPDDVNLLGPLPEKTVAGAIAHTDDAADTVPVKSTICSIVPKQAGTGTPSPSNPRAISGSDNLLLYKYGKNLVNGYTDYNVTNKIVEPVFLKAGNYTISFQRDAVVQAIYIRKGDTVSLVGNAYLQKFNTTFFAFNADIDGYYFFQLYRSGSSATWEEAPISNVQLEVGSTKTTYEAYTAPETISDSWSSIGTIYGGERDLVEGTLKKTHEYISSYNGEAINEPWISSIDEYVSGTTPSTGAQVVYPLTTPVIYSNLSTYDFETLYAVNNFFSDIDGGQTQVTYRQDIALALAALQGSRSLSASLMRSAGPDLEERSEDPEEVSELEENIQNTEEQEGENDER